MEDLCLELENLFDFYFDNLFTFDIQRYKNGVEVIIIRERNNKENCFSIINDNTYNSFTATLQNILNCTNTYRIRNFSQFKSELYIVLSKEFLGDLKI